jgi:hypothetical protein
LTFNQLNFSLPRPTLEHFFARDGEPDILKLLEVDQPMNLVLAGEPWSLAVAMFMNAATGRW